MKWPKILPLFFHTFLLERFGKPNFIMFPEKHPEQWRFGSMTQ
jgi:hypothetical protein